MVLLRRTVLLRYLLLLAILALLLFISSSWLRKCFVYWLFQAKPPLAPEGWLEAGGPLPLIKDCPGKLFQAWRLLLYLKSSLSDDDDVLLEPYLQSWDQLLKFMESLGTMASFFSQKVKEKVVLIQQLSLKHSAEAHGIRGPAYRSVRSMVEMELKAGAVDFSHRTDSGCRTLLRLHRSLLWLKLMLEGLAEGPDADGQYRTPGELSRDAYMVALAPHHPWVLRQAAEFVFLALPDRQYFLQLVCVQNQQEAVPILRIIIHALTLVHTRTQQILAEHGMLELP
uniref:Glycolipid transfer protein domain-containing protein n=1 Tax=Monopterus albus TaxID=43700 RepID=A0A3Q3QCK0_MONAL